MDPLAHTLVGACLAEAGLRHRSRLALPALLLGANLPDVDALTMLAGRDCMYDFRRGVTHGPMGVLLGPWLLVGVLWIADRWLDKKRHLSEPPHFWQLLGITYLAVLTHPFLDWLNNYGVRLLSPLSQRWFYGDALFIIDPWLWLALGGAAVLAWSRSVPSIATWVVLGLSTTGLVLWAPMVPLTAKLLWCLLALAILLARQSRRLAQHSSQAARAALALLGGYIAAMLALTAIAHSRAGAFFEERGVTVERIIAGPVAARSFVRDVIAVTPSGYRFLEVDFLEGATPVEAHEPISKNQTPEARAALEVHDIQGFAHWLRFPAFTTQRRDGGYRVWIRDVRYSRTPGDIGRVRVDLDAELHPLAVSFDAAVRQEE